MVNETQTRADVSVSCVSNLDSCTPMAGVSFQDDAKAYMWYTLACDREPELIDNKQASGLRESL